MTPPRVAIDSDDPCGDDFAVLTWARWEDAEAVAWALQENADPVEMWSNDRFWPDGEEGAWSMVVRVRQVPGRLWEAWGYEWVDGVLTFP